MGYAGYKGVKALSGLQETAAPAIGEVKKSALGAIESARQTAEHFKGTSEATRVATSHLYSLGKLWRNIGFTHDPANPAGAEMLVHPAILRKSVRKGYREGFASGITRHQTPTERLGYGVMRRILGSPRTDITSAAPLREVIGKRIGSRLSRLNSLEDYIQFKQGELKEKAEEVKNKLKNVKLSKKKGHRLHGGGT